MASHGTSESMARTVPGARRKSFFGLGPSFLRKLLAHIAFGTLVVETPSGERVRHVGRAEGPEAILVLHRWRGLRRLAMKGDVGFAQGYIDGDWSSPDLSALIELAALNSPALQRLMRGVTVARWVNRATHLLRANTRTGSRRNIAFHYDLGNDFYSLWLDETMTYSSALYTRDDLTLESAQDAKIDRVVSLLDPKRDDAVLEVGCGWGTLARKLARDSGAQVTALTLSKEQRLHAHTMFMQSGLANQIDVRLQDYRDVSGQYDRIVSIEMLEAVGEAFWPVYFDGIRQRLKRDGRAVLQVITINEDRFNDYRAGADFIQSYIFPGGMLPSKTALQAEIGRARLKLVEMECFGQSYARTLAEWRMRFHRAWPQIEALGFGESFRRLWDYYLCYCEGGFRAGAIDVGLYAVVHDDGAVGP